MSGDDAATGDDRVPLSCPHEADARAVFDLLHREHREALELCGRLTAGAGNREVLRHELTDALERHMAMEEATFYPALESVGQNLSFVQRMKVEHGVIREAMDTVRRIELADPGFDAAARYLLRVVDEHVGREEREAFGYAEESIEDRDLAVLAVEMEHQRQVERGAWGV